MEVMLKGNVAVQGETDVKCAGDEESGEIGKFGSEMPACRRDSSRSPSPGRRDSSNNKQDNLQLIESIKEEMGEAREENERLKAFLEQMVKDYQSLKMHFFDIVQKEHFKKPAETTSGTLGDVEEPELVSLSLGSTASRNSNEEEKRKENERINEGLTLGLRYKIDHGPSSSRSEPPVNLSPDNSFEEPKKEDAAEPWPPNKTIFESSRNGEDEVLVPQPPVKKARVSVRARCDAPTMNDGCQWRKYGQKTAKGNPCPRAYYRCTAAPACPVKKQVQRCAEDMSILITTYEGTHNHPLPMSATAMASTTSAAASMLISGSSSTSHPAFGSPAASTTTSYTANLHGLGNLLDNSRLMKHEFYPPNPSIYCSPNNYQYPTITIDLTTPSSTTPHAHFSSSNGSMPSSWGNGLYSSYGAQSYNRPIHSGSLNHGSRQARDYSFFLSHSQKAASPTTTGGQQFLADTIAKAIASEPSFQSALAAAVTSYVGSQGAQVTGEGSDQLGLKWTEQATSMSTGTGLITELLGPSTRKLDGRFSHHHQRS